MTVARLGLDRATNTPVVFLREAVGDRGVPIWIGAPEANAIALVLQGAVAPRPMTHDLAKQLLDRLGGALDRAVITGVRDNTYYAELHVRRADGSVQVVDARPSDAIAIALRTDAPILVADELLRPIESSEAPPEPLVAEALRKHLEALDPQDFGRFVP